MNSTMVIKVRRSVYSLFLISTIIILTSLQVARAGFEWMPQEKSSPSVAMKNKMNQISPTLTPVPMPGRELTPEMMPAIAPEMIYATPPLITQPIPRRHVVRVTRQELLPVVNQMPMPMPTPMPVMSNSVAPANQIVHGSVIKVKTITNMNNISRTSRAIMPDDAPAGAFKNIPGSQRLTDTKIQHTDPMLPLPSVLVPTERAAISYLDNPKPSTRALTIAYNPVLIPQASPQLAASFVKIAAPKLQTRSFANVTGFGSDLPLALALRQVVPAEYAFSFDPEVNPGYRVSWDGGKPWNQIVSDMIRPLNLEAHIVGNTLRVKIKKPGKNKGEYGQNTRLQIQNNMHVASMYKNVKRNNITDPGEHNISTATPLPLLPEDRI